MGSVKRPATKKVVDYTESEDDSVESVPIKKI